MLCGPRSLWARIRVLVRHGGARCDRDSPDLWRHDSCIGELCRHDAARDRDGANRHGRSLPSRDRRSRSGLTVGLRRSHRGSARLGERCWTQPRLRRGDPASCRAGRDSPGQRSRRFPLQRTALSRPSSLRISPEEWTWHRGGARSPPSHVTWKPVFTHCEYGRYQLSVILGQRTARGVVIRPDFAPNLDKLSRTAASRTISEELDVSRIDKLRSA